MTLGRSLSQTGPRKGDFFSIDGLNFGFCSDFKSNECARQVSMETNQHLCVLITRAALMTANVLTYIYPFLDPRRSRPGAHARPRTHLLRALRRQTESGLFFASDFEQIKRLFAGVYLVGFRRFFGVLTCS